MSSDKSALSWREDDPVLGVNVVSTPPQTGISWTVEVVTAHGAYVVLSNLCERACRALMRDLAEAEDRRGSVMARWVRESADELDSYGLSADEPKRYGPGR